MKAILTALIASLLITPVEAGQKRKAPNRTRTNSSSRERANTTAAPLIGSQVVIVTKNGDRITGTLLDLSAYSVRIRSSNLESTHALDTISSLSFGASPATSAEQGAGRPVRAEFARDAQSALATFQSISSETKRGVDYTDYGRQLTELRRVAERFIGKYSMTDNATEARTVTLLAGALTDYTWARTVWTLKLSRSGENTVRESDSTVADVLALYPDLRAATTTGDKISGDKLVSGLWQKASEKIERARSFIA